jgi:hypothetical protein
LPRIPPTGSKGIADSDDRLTSKNSESTEPLFYPNALEDDAQPSLPMIRPSVSARSASLPLELTGTPLPQSIRANSQPPAMSKSAEPTPSSTRYRPRLVIKTSSTAHRKSSATFAPSPLQQVFVIDDDETPRRVNLLSPVDEDLGLLPSNPVMDGDEPRRADLLSPVDEDLGLLPTNLIMGGNERQQADLLSPVNKDLNLLPTNMDTNNDGPPQHTGLLSPINEDFVLPPNPVTLKVLAGTDIAVKLSQVFDDTAISDDEVEATEDKSPGLDYNIITEDLVAETPFKADAVKLVQYSTTWGTSWARTFGRYIRFEASDDFPIQNLKIASEYRVKEVGEWWKKRRRCLRAPKAGNRVSSGFGEKVLALWEHLQPSGRAPSTSVKAIPPDGWSSLRVRGNNGFCDVMAALILWREDIDFAGNKLSPDFRNWSCLVIDVGEVLCVMLGSSSTITAANGTTSAGIVRTSNDEERTIKSGRKRNAPKAGHSSAKRSRR